MNRTETEWWLQRIAGAAGAIAMITALIILVLQLARAARVEERIALDRGQVIEIEESNRSTEASLEREDARVKQIASDVMDLVKKKDATLKEMADVLARVKVLQQQRDIFESKRSDIEQKMSQMSDYYLAARTAVPSAGIGPNP